MTKGEITPLKRVRGASLQEEMLFMDSSMPLIQIFNELKKTIPFKETTAEGDIILVGMKQGLSYGVILGN